MEEIKPVVLENRQFVYREKVSIIPISPIFSLRRFQFKEQVRQYYCIVEICSKSEKMTTATLLEFIKSNSTNSVSNVDKDC